MILPKVYTSPNGNYKEHIGKPKMSYSFYNSWKEQGYKGEAIASHFLGIKSQGNIFTEFGGRCGKYFEDGTKEGLTDFDFSVIDKVHRPNHANYEVEIVVDRGSYVIQGYLDQEYTTEEGLILNDLKTGAIKSKKSYYEGELFQQTTLYCHQRAKEGHKIHHSGVILLDRAGNGSDKHPLRLTGEIEYIPTPYSEERAEAFLKDFDKTTEEISEYYSIYLKYFR